MLTRNNTLYERLVTSIARNITMLDDQQAGIEAANLLYDAAELLGPTTVGRAVKEARAQARRSSFRLCPKEFPDQAGS